MSATAATSCSRATATPTVRGVYVKADPTNTGVIYVGHSDVTTGATADATDGYRLSANEEVFISIDDANKVYVIGSAAGQAVYWLIT